MSAYIVEDKTVNRIITALVADYHRNFQWNKNRILEAAQIEAGDQDWTTKLGISMAALNDAGVNARYGEGTAANDRGELYQWHMTIPDNLLQTYKSLGCFLYQCAEGNVPETPLYKALEDWKHVIAEHIISALPAYDKADWA